MSFAILGDDSQLSISPSSLSIWAAALTLAAEGLSVFPCRANKAPATPHGFKDASRDPETIRNLWRCRPGPLIGIATGTASDLAVLDIDVKHAEAREWWQANCDRLPPTRMIRTRGGGSHIWFRHSPGLRCSTGIIARGVDVRATGGYAIAWHAAGQSVLRDAPLAPWPDWLSELLRPVPQPPRPLTPPAGSDAVGRYATAALRRAVQRVASAPEGVRNNILNAECYCLTRFVREGTLDASEIADALAIAAVHAGLTPRETAATLASALRAGCAA
jgi:hypothetical protein